MEDEYKVNDIDSRENEKLLYQYCKDGMKKKALDLIKKHPEKCKFDYIDRDDYSFTPLLYTCFYKNMHEVALEMLKHYADKCLINHISKDVYGNNGGYYYVDDKRVKVNALILACRYGLKNVALKILDYTNDFTICDCYHNNALEYAANADMEEVILKMLDKYSENTLKKKLIVSYKIPPDHKDYDLFFDCEYKQYEYQNGREYTLFDYACLFKLHKVALKVLDFESKIVGLNNHSMIFACNSKMEDIVLKLLYKKDFKFSFYENCIDLLNICKNNLHIVAKEIIKLPLKYYELDETVFFIACKNKMKDVMIKYLSLKNNINNFIIRESLDGKYISFDINILTKKTLEHLSLNEIQSILKDDYVINVIMSEQNKYYLI